MIKLSDDSGRPIPGEPMPPAAAGDAMRRAIAVNAIELLGSSAPEALIPKLLERIGQACGVSRVQLYEHKRTSGGAVASSMRYAWRAAGIAPPSGTETSAGSPLPGRNEAVALFTRDASEPLKTDLTQADVKSMLTAPIFVGSEAWGAIDFQDCAQERVWSGAEIDTLKLLADMIGAAIGRARDLRESSDITWIIEHSPVILYRVSGRPPFPMTYISRNVRRYGYEAADLLAAPDRYLDLFHPEDRTAIMESVGEIVNGHVGEIQRERRLRAADGHYVWFEQITRGHYGPQHELLEVEGLLIDISERKAAESRIEQISTVDPVTGLPNRATFMAELDRAYLAARRGGPAFAIHYLDLDRFKDVNDVFGHTKGDELLKAVADRLRRLRRSNTDMIARSGGDEFVILQSDISEPSDAGALAARLLKAIAEPFSIGIEIHTTASIGIAVFTPEVSGTEELIKQADLALYRAKDLGRNQFHFHSEALDEATIERVTLGGDLAHALDRGELRLDYQPQVELATGRIVGFEALARWDHPRLGPIGPSRFVPIAEGNGTIHRLGHWVVDAVCHQISDWRDAGLKPPPISFNVSAGQLKGTADFDRQLAERLKHWSVGPKAVEIELTETVLMETTQRHREIIGRLYSLGVPIAIDDFGTGYSSLSYLRAYRVDHIKVAQEFIKDIKPGSGDIAIVRAAISLGRELGIPVIAEGVETEFQLDLVREAGCQYVQGFYFSPPVSADRAAELLRQGALLPGGDAKPPG